MKLLRSVTSPTVSASTSASSSSLIRCQRLRGRYARESAEHFCPWYSNAPRISAVFRVCGSAERCATRKSLPPVSPTIRGYARYEGRLAPMVCQSDWKVAVEPVKCRPASAGSASATWESCRPSPVTMLITPGGSPAASSTRIR